MAFFTFSNCSRVVLDGRPFCIIARTMSKKKNSRDSGIAGEKQSFTTYDTIKKECNEMLLKATKS
jgi:hypothetical protein